MSEKGKARLIKYSCSGVFAVLMVLFCLQMQAYGEATEPVEKYRLLCDAFTVPGVLLIAFGALVWASNEGALLGIGYALRQAIFALIPGKRLEKDEKYADYVTRKRENRITGYGFLFYTGLVCVGIALIFMALFYSVYGK